MKTIHLIANAHLDPVWLWPWHNGLDAALNTCRTIVGFLHRHPEVTFTSGEAWKYRWIQRLDPGAFTAIRDLIAVGRWEVIGGWWLQPDCNAPSGFALGKQIELGQRYFRDTFGSVPRIAYNVDSFGHAATLPGIIRAAGQDRYVMMRPQEHEMELPSRLFRWRGYDGAPEVVTFRVAGGYGDFNQMSVKHLEQSLEGLPDGTNDTMCFVGVGDHGGGPNEMLLRWLNEHEGCLPGVRWIWSTPSRFFDAVEPQTASLPVVTGELQQHAVGCFSVYRPFKVAVRKAEHLLAQAQTVCDPVDQPELDEAWRTVCFGHFHDSLGGTCTATAYAQLEAQIGGAVARADEILHATARKSAIASPPHKLQRIIVHNASEGSSDELIQWEYWWRDGGEWKPEWQLLEASGASVPYQLSPPEAVFGAGLSRLVFRLSLKPNETRVLYIDRAGRPARSLSAGVSCANGVIRSACGAGVVLTPSAAALQFAERTLPVPELHLIEDLTDTWSHGLDRYPAGPARGVDWDPPMIFERGPLMAALIQRGRVGTSLVQCEFQVFADTPFVDLLLRVDWRDVHHVLKLVWPMPMQIESREDGIMGGSFCRASHGRELPARDFSLLQLSDGLRVGVVFPDVYATDASPEALRLTLLRNPVMAHHVPALAKANPRARHTDTGVHTFRFRFYCGGKLNPAILDRDAMAIQRPPVLVDHTAGMDPIFT